jgi:uncharacterized protein YfbU (UPF0304 family)
MAEMKLDTKDRLILSNQYKILESLYPNEACDYKQHRTIVEHGYELFYSELTTHIYDGLNDNHCREVLDILEMYRRLSCDYKQLKDRGDINATDVKFGGFDGNNESSYLLFHEFLIEQGKFSESPAGNSHTPSLAIYRRMLEDWKPRRNKDQLNLADIQAIVKARIHPDNR